MMKEKLIKPPYSIPLKEQINNYLHDPVYMILLALTAIGSYGFWISHFSVSNDDLLYNFYNYGGLFAQGRFTGSLVTRFFRLTDNIIWIQDFLGIAFLCFAVILLSAFFDSFYKTKNHIPQILFSCLFVSYPLHATFFRYVTCSLAFSAGLTMAVSALFLVKRYIETRKIKFLISSVIPLIFVMSWYESVLVLYVQAVLAALLLFQLGTKRLKLSELFANGFVYALPMIIAIVLEFVLSKALIAVLKISASVYQGNKPALMRLDFSDKKTLLDQLNYIVMGNYLRSAIQALFSVPMIVFMVAFLLLFVIGLVHGVRQKNAALFWSFFGLAASNCVLPLLMGNVVLRTSQPFAFTIAFAAFLVYDFTSARTKEPRRVLSKLVLIALSCLIIAQAIETNELFTTDDMRYQQEAAIITGVGNYLEEHDLDGKPIVFAGKIDFNENIKSRLCVRKDNKLFQALLKVPHLGEYCKGLADKRNDAYAFPRLENFCVSYINHAIIYDNYFLEITEFFHFCGFDTIQYGTKEQQEEAQQYMTELPAWPRQGAVKDMGDYVIVNFGESTMNGVS